MNIYEKKKLINEISKLSADVHQKIFEIMISRSGNVENIKYSKKYSSDGQIEGILIDLNDIDNEIVAEIKTFVEQYNKHIKYSEEVDILYIKAQECVDTLSTNDYSLDQIHNSMNNK